jgi:hypothetical protein
VERVRGAVRNGLGERQHGGREVGGALVSGALVRDARPGDSGQGAVQCAGHGASSAPGAAPVALLSHPVHRHVRRRL